MPKLKQFKYGQIFYFPNDKFVGRSLDFYGEYSDEEVKILEYIVKSDSFVVDAGANIGALTIPMAKKNATVFAFEPQRLTFYALCSNILLNNLTNTICYQIALGNENKEIEISEINYDDNYNIERYFILKQDENSNKIKVPMRTLDSYNLSKCDLIKADIEGMEYELLLGARNTIDKYKPILYLEDDGYNNRIKYILLLEDLGYNCWHHLPKLYNENNFENNNNNIFGDLLSINLLCLHKKSNINISHFNNFKLTNKYIYR